MKCPKCGKQNSDDAPLCSSCGWVLCWKPATPKADRRIARRLLTPVLISVVVLLIILVLITTAKRGSRVEYIDISKESMAPYQAIYEVDRKTMGFPPLPSEGTVKVEMIDRENWNYEWDPPNYDVALQFYEINGNSYKYTARCIALKKKNGVLQWISESMMFHGPKEYIDDEGFSAKEYISITCETEQVAVLGENISGTMVTYTGPDKRLVRAEGYKPVR